MFPRLCSQATFIAETKTKTFFVSWRQKLFPQQRFRMRTNGKHSGKQCLQDNVPSIAGAFRTDVAAFNAAWAILTRDQQHKPRDHPR